MRWTTPPLFWTLHTKPSLVLQATFRHVNHCSLWALSSPPRWCHLPSSLRIITFAWQGLVGAGLSVQKCIGNLSRDVEGNSRLTTLRDVLQSTSVRSDET